ncbi:DNA/RNA nuclease SfsA [Alkalilimnicola sp. S0819]|uniref:DNA/RNA nuclease SfsA n=1 Tax=Alkalilimnicola sp. S0819 TaxID=2613922 RepID=UPI0012622432|nr:DNA/RNA nuclease SfsA [Alkalilimnicola sp. S0819]KAB7627635.1 DNA/RNA nuclease SfsA [Alkalilimnicola sp. S0819]MPQ15800.1 DNA/RNA nuclease SfsA [Alkalilimnicola sp. S0819]
MDFPETLREARLIRRYKRFLADVRGEDGELFTAHCPNTGSMLGCTEPGSRVWLSRSDNPKRKYAHTWELVELADGTRVGLHTGRSNALVEEAWREGLLPELAGYRELRREVSVPGMPMRADMRLRGNGLSDCWLEVKNVTAAVEAGVAIFPDAVSERGTRHLGVLSRLVGRGERAVLVFCVQRDDVGEVRPADAIDPAYGRALRGAIAAGVEVYALGAQVGPRAISLNRRLPVVCPPL